MAGEKRGKKSADIERGQAWGDVQVPDHVLVVESIINDIAYGRRYHGTYEGHNSVPIRSLRRYYRLIDEGLRA